MDNVTHSLAGLVLAEACHARRIVPPDGIPERPSTRAVRWKAIRSGPVSELVAIARASCVARAALRFIRVPVWRPRGDSAVMLGDERYSGPTGGFSTVEVSRRGDACPPDVPPWTPPRADLLGR